LWKPKLIYYAVTRKPRQEGGIRAMNAWVGGWPCGTEFDPLLRKKRKVGPALETRVTRYSFGGRRRREKHLVRASTRRHMLPSDRSTERR